LLVAVVALVTAAIGSAAEAEAAFPGSNGKVAFSRTLATPGEERCIYVANANGTGQVPLLGCDPEAETNPRWSPDGAQIAYTGWNGQIDLVNADGSNLREFFFDSGVGTTGHGWSPDATQIAVSWFDCFDELPCGSRIEKLNATTGSYSTILSTADFVSEVDWSPDGDLIAFARQFQLYTIRSDGTGLAQLAPGSPGENYAPSWSPNGAKIAFASNRDENEEIYVMNADGTGQVRLTDEVGFDASPRWSPDGTKIVFESDRDGGNHEIYVMNADGTGQTRFTNNPGSDSAPDWQPVLVGYPRPKNAAATKFSLVPAYTQCTAANRMHGPPLAHPSCNPPTRVSSQLTVGSPDSNGKTANFEGFVRYRSISGNTGTPTIDEADVSIQVQVSDVYRQGTLTDYNGELSARTIMRVTDRLNTPYPGGSGPGTVADHGLSATVPCTTTADPNVGATCGVFTSADALIPGRVVEGKRSVWEHLGSVQIDDGGPDSDADTLGDNTPFLTQGVFAP
jgi:dipeptidyl aminopeptidase/acylaminoacyl peptidase